MSPNLLIIISCSLLSSFSVIIFSTYTDSKKSNQLNLRSNYTRELAGTELNVFNWGEYISDGYDGSLDVNAEFEKPGDKVVYEFKVENTGSINAYLKSINLEGQSTNTEKIKLSYTVKNNDKSTVYAEGSIAGETAINTIVPVEKVALLNKQTIQNESTVTEYNYLTITFEYLDEITEVASNKSATYTLTLYYEQTDAS